MQFSNIFDLTSRFQLPVAGYETLQLHSLQQPLEPGQGYSLPEWAQGGWGDSFSVDGGTVMYDRASDFTRYSLLQRYLLSKIEESRHQNSKSEILTTKIETPHHPPLLTRYTLHTVSSPRSNHFLVRVHTSCSSPAYSCLALHLR